MSASNEAAKKSPKRVLAKLTQGEEEREAQRWSAASVEQMSARGAKNGLAEFVHEVEKELSPLFATP